MSGEIGKIVWATDGSEPADNALPYVAALATSTGASVELVHVVEELTGRYARGASLEASDPVIQTKILTQGESLSSSGIEVGIAVVPGAQKLAAHAIAEEAERAGADMIVVGTRGHTAVGSNIVLGSVTQRLLHIAPCPVLAVPDHIR